MTNYIIPTVKEIKASLSAGHKFEVVSLFAGGGGSSTGYRMAGGKVLAANEFIPEAQETYKANWDDTHLFTCDIRRLDAGNILSVINKKAGELDILDGSPPCSAFSSLGTREKGWGKLKKYSDSEQHNVEDLFFEYIRILRGVKPKVFIAENVAGLTKGVAKGYLNEILRNLKQSGYQVNCKILDAKFLGVPQSRTRAIFIGVRDDLWRPDIVTHPKPIDYIITLKQAFNGLVFTEQDNKDTDLSKYSTYKMLIGLKAGEQHSKRFSLIKASSDQVCGCITATSSSISSSSIRHWDNRAFTVSEIKRIMSIPDDYILTGSYKQQIERLGRMVPPLMMKAIAENIYNEVLAYENT